MYGPGSIRKWCLIFSSHFCFDNLPSPLPPGSDRPDKANLFCMYNKKSALLILRLSDWEIKCLSNGLNWARVGVNQYIKWSLGQGDSETRLMKEWKGLLVIYANTNLPGNTTWNSTSSCFMMESKTSSAKNVPTELELTHIWEPI